MTIALHIQGPNLGAEVTLYQIDLSVFGIADFFLTPGPGRAGAIVFDGQTYAPHPISASGFEVTTNGPLPRPKLTVANIDNALTAIVEENDDLTGAIVTRIRTYERFLDGQPDADPEAIKPPDVYQIARKTGDDGSSITWELAALTDQDGVELPGRRISRDYCDHVYRRWTGAAFDYTEASCPYNGAQSYDLNGAPVASALDAPSKQLTTCCKARFGANAVLPTRAFPGVARLIAR